MSFLHYPFVQMNPEKILTSNSVESNESLKDLCLRRLIVAPTWIP